MTEFLDVTVKVPAGRLAAFYEAFGRWLEEPVALSNDAPALKAWDSASDLELATLAWSGFPERARLLFGTLIDHPDRRFSGVQLAELHDIPNGMYGVAGVWAWPGRQLRSMGRPLPFNIEANPTGGSLYAMSPAMAKLFAEARRGAVIL